MAFLPDDESQRLVYERTPELEDRAGLAGAELLILPEGFGGRVEGDEPATMLGPNPSLPVLFGAQRVEGTKTYQTAYMWDGKNWSVADKTRLVVFGEYVPGREQLSILKNFKLSNRDLSPGTELRQLNVNQIKVGPLLCFEGLFPDLGARHERAGAQALAVMSIDDWYEDTPAWDQLWQSLVLRSVESGLPLWRSGSRGMTFATDSRGRIIGSLKPKEMGVLNVVAQVPNRGDGFTGRFAMVWLGWACLAWLTWEAWRTRKQSE